MRADDKLSCPSATNSRGASLLGVVNDVGVISFLPKVVPLDDELISLGGQNAEAKYRYTSPCVQKGCNQWDGSGCGVIKKLQESELNKHEQKIKDCPIRINCRWFFQEGEAACKICPLIVADLL